MGRVEVRFVGLHLIDNRLRDGSKVVAVINAQQQGVWKKCGEKEIELDVHVPRIRIDGTIADADWPDTPDPSGKQLFELKGRIWFSPGGTVDDLRSKRLQVNNECPGFTMPDAFFETLGENDKGKHALVSITAGRLSLFKIRGTESIHMSVDFGALQPFRMEREDRKFIELDPSANATITFLNTELTSRNDYDWLWYLHATGNPCCGKPNEKDVPDNVTVIDDDGITISPITLGCSNSNWP